ncbi:MAG: DNA-formamidopyrimidine glycosylase family protein [Micrococcus sp.]|nr:DNA-formamidopyrimidine glycosylase family protein [Micrococcus sp.]
MPEGDSLVRAAHRVRAAFGLDPFTGRRGPDHDPSLSTLTSAELRVPAHATAQLVGFQVTSVDPRSKYLLIRLEAPAASPLTGPRELTLLSHLKMEGRWWVGEMESSAAAPQAPPQPPRWPAPAWKVRCVLGTAHRLVLGIELGLLELLPTADEADRLGFLGPDLLDPAWDRDPETAAELLAESVRRLTADPDRPVGLALLDQRLVSGIGNIYRCESLLLAGIDPHRRIGDVDDVPGLVLLARDLLRANVPPAVPALGHTRTTTQVRPDAAAPFGVRVLVRSPRPGVAAPTRAPAGLLAPRGRPQSSSWVYGHQRQPCFRCRGPVRREDYGSPEDPERQLWWCPRCQT